MKKIFAILLTVLLLLFSFSTLAAVYDDKDTVLKVQQALNDAGFDCGAPDGVAGKKQKP